jgi:hypothetical protein
VPTGPKKEKIQHEDKGLPASWAPRDNLRPQFQLATTERNHSLPPKWDHFFAATESVRVSLRIHMCPYTPRPIETRRVGLPDACRIFVTRNSVCRRQLIRLR